MGMRASEVGAVLGVTPQAINKAARRGRIPRESDGTFDLAAVQAVWVGNANQHQRARGLKAKSTLVTPKPAVRHVRRADIKAKAIQTPEGAEQSDISLAEAQRQLEWIKVEKQRLELEKLEAKLINADDVRLATESRFATEKEALLNWPTRVSGEIAADLGVEERLVHQVLDAQIRIFLTERSVSSGSPS